MDHYGYLKEVDTGKQRRLLKIIILFMGQEDMGAYIT